MNSCFDKSGIFTGLKYDDKYVRRRENDSKNFRNYVFGRAEYKHCFNNGFLVDRCTHGRELNAIETYFTRKGTEESRRRNNIIFSRRYANLVRNNKTNSNQREKLKELFTPVSTRLNKKCRKTQLPPKEDCSYSSSMFSAPPTLPRPINTQLRARDRYKPLSKDYFKPKDDLRAIIV